jgi:hypothetical protein
VDADAGFSGEHKGDSEGNFERNENRLRRSIFVTIEEKINELAENTREIMVLAKLDLDFETLKKENVRAAHTLLVDACANLSLIECLL